MTRQLGWLGLEIGDHAPNDKTWLLESWKHDKVWPDRRDHTEFIWNANVEYDHPYE